MSIAASLVQRIRQVGGDVELLDDGKIALRRRSAIPDDLAAEVRTHVSEVRTFLRSPASYDAELEDLLRRWALLCAERIVAEVQR